MTAPSQQFLTHLNELWVEEQEAVHERFVEQRQEFTLKERVERGIALRNLYIVDTDAAVGDRVLLWLAPDDVREMEGLQVGPGDPVRLWRDNPDSEEAVLGVVSRRKPDKLGVVVDGNYPDHLEEGGFHLDGDEPQTTFERGKRAIRRFREAEKLSPTGRLREVMLGGGPAQFDKEPDLTWQDKSLNEPQQRAVQRAMAAQDIALIHGPPGTGKTRTLVEVICQATARGERVLATAASNAAVDNLAERLLASGLSIVRMGHPARVTPEVEAHTLDALVEQTGAYDLSRKWIIEANNLRRKIQNKSSRSGLSRSERRELYREVRSLFRDARMQRQGAQEAILAQASVICATATGADHFLLKDERFDLVVVDEATQAPDPIALVPLSRANRAVLAGDPCQLPPTVISLTAEQNGLGTTIFERLAETEEADMLRLLTVQYRMNETIMSFPSASMYDNQLIAHESVASHELSQLDGVAEDPIRSGVMIFVDTAGKGWEEVSTDDDPSTSNPQQAERTVAEVKRLLGRGISPGDVAIITPYNAQVRRLREQLRPEMEAGLEVGSVDGFQGREKEAIVIDMVRCNDDNEIGFLADTRRMNVALTRARRFLLVLGDSATLGQNQYYSAFLEATEQLGAWSSAWDDDAPPFES
ncbi:MAG: AAA family ATPase [Deltaproteobacteria bacterium]|nr:MAG: AAA family ATPase [Deltaproteobacteria bacterium]